MWTPWLSRIYSKFDNIKQNNHEYTLSNKKLNTSIILTEKEHKKLKELKIKTPVIIMLGREKEPVKSII